LVGGGQQGWAMETQELLPGRISKTRRIRIRKKKRSHHVRDEDAGNAS